MAKYKKKKSWLLLIWQFVKLQIAGNVLFLGTLGGTFVFKELLGWHDIAAFVISSLISNAFFFLLNRDWVFADGKKDTKNKRKKNSQELVRFIIFMVINFFINLGIVNVSVTYFDVSVYLAQFFAGFFFTFWNYAGLKFWVFQETHHHAVTIKKVRRHHG